jgi:hypothetical protein
MDPIPLFGNGIVGKSRVVTAQRRLNCYYEVREDGDKTKIAVYGTPGSRLRFTVNTLLNKPLRAFFGTEDALYAVAHDQFYSLDSFGSALFSGTIGTASNQAEIIENNNDVVTVDGANGYLFRAGVLTTLQGGFPNGARTITAVDGFFIAELPGTQQFYVSDEFDGETWDPLAFASASQYTDLIVAVDNLGGLLIPFSNQHFEVWQNVGATPQPFQPIKSATSEYGLAAIYSRAHVDNSIIFLAQTRQGTVQFRRLQGTTAIKISTPDLDYIINRFSVKSDAVALSYQKDDHPMYQCTFPTANRSFLFDCSTNMWGETQTGPSTTPTRQMGNLSAYYAGQTLVSDYRNGNVYELDEEYFSDNGEIIPREIVTRHVQEGFNVFGVDELYFDLETGVGIATGQGSNPKIMIQVSKNNGRNFGVERWFNVGAQGKYLTRVNTRLWGSARDMSWRLRYTEPTKFVITGAAISSRMRKQ